MRGRSLVLLAAVGVGLAAWQVRPHAQSPAASATLTVHVRFAARTSLKVSSSELRFDVASPGALARATVQFAASARTRNGGEVMLTVEPAGIVDSPDGRATSSLSIVCEDERGQAAPLQGARVVGRWIGSGTRRGSVAFTLEGATHPGSYSMPVRFVLSAP